MPLLPAAWHHRHHAATGRDAGVLLRRVRTGVVHRRTGEATRL